MLCTILLYYTMYNVRASLRCSVHSLHTEQKGMSSFLTPQFLTCKSAGVGSKSGLEVVTLGGLDVTLPDGLGA